VDSDAGGEGWLKPLAAPRAGGRPNRSLTDTAQYSSIAPAHPGAGDAKPMTSIANLDIDTMLEAIEALNDGIAIYGPDEYPIYTNTATRRRFGSVYADMDAGLSYRDALAKSVRHHLPNASAETVEAITARIFHSFHSGETYTAFSDDGRTVQVTFRNMSRGRKVAISVDVTDLREREKDLDAARKAALAASASKSNFLANMSHEIRTPLNGVLGMAQVLENTRLDDAQREFVSTIIESGKTLMALLNDVLDLSKIEAGKFDIAPADTDIAHLMRRTYRLWKPRAEEKGLELTLALDTELPEWLAFDAVRVQQCVSNLISNAIKFTAKGRVEAFVGSKPLPNGVHLVEIRVRDTGAGMDAETLARLFQPFAQADETISRKHGGTGLGLSITRRLAELMGGTASAESEPGRGSTFRVSFRASPAKPRASRTETDRSASAADVRSALLSSQLRVLLVDDHPINRQVVSLFLRPFNMRIVEAVNGVEALAALEREPFDVVLLDMHMPVMDGPTAVARIRASGQPWAGMPVIALTADAMSGDREKYLALGMTGYLSKPVAERDLLSEIARVRGGAELPLARVG
jgi:signal transduction histidine kinase/ActR/RegA family two-component response regulator